MKKAVLSIFCTLIVLSLNIASVAGAADSGPGGGEYYVFSRSDSRLCPSPLCGGMFVRRINRFLTRCNDGVFRTDCYIADLDLDPLFLTDDAAYSVRSSFTAKELIIRGTFAPFSTDFPTLNVLVADEAWEERGTARPGIIYAFFRDNGIRCIAGPCPWIDASIMNTPISGTISGFVLDSSGAAEEDIAEGYRGLSSTGIIATGRVKLTRGPAGKGLIFEATRFYLKTQSRLICGGSAEVSCPDDMFCDIAPPDSCSGQNVNGTCNSIPEACAMIYDPVCGCDGKTYANDCERLASQVLLDHVGECAAMGNY